MAEAKSSGRPSPSEAPREVVLRGERSGFWRLLIWLLELCVSAAFIGATCLAFYNVFGVSLEVERLANETACLGQPKSCKAQCTLWERTPIAHTFHMMTPSGTKPVKCQREKILLGEWSCAIPGETTAAASAAPSASAVPPREALIAAPASRPSPKVKATSPSTTARPVYSTTSPGPIGTPN